jgi:hypothetical protein
MIPGCTFALSLDPNVANYCSQNHRDKAEEDEANYGKSPAMQTDWS